MCIKVVISRNIRGDVELNWNPLSVSRLSKRCIYNISGTPNSIGLTLSENIEGDIELNQKILCACRLSQQLICNISGTAKRIKLKRPESVCKHCGVCKFSKGISGIYHRKLRLLS